MSASVAWEHELQSWLEPFSNCFVIRPVGACARSSLLG
jgi:hypothetical protein